MYKDRPQNYDPGRTSYTSIDGFDAKDLHKFFRSQYDRLPQQQLSLFVSVLFQFYFSCADRFTQMCRRERGQCLKWSPAPSAPALTICHRMTDDQWM